MSMISLSLIAAAVLSASPPVAPAPLTLERLAATHCKNNRSPVPERIAALFRVEHEEGVSKAARGILAAAACYESGYRAFSIGDDGKAIGIVQFWSWARPHIRRLRRKLCKALPRPERKLSIHCLKLKDSRQDWLASSIFWARRLVRHYRKAKVLCDNRGGYSTWEDLLWASADLTLGRSPTCFRQGGCIRWADNRTCERWGCAMWGVRCAQSGDYETGHWELLEQWRALLPEIKPKQTQVCPLHGGCTGDAGGQWLLGALVSER